LSAVLPLPGPDALNAAFAEIVRRKAGALLIGASPFFLTRTKQLVEQAARNALPTMYWRENQPTAAAS
jgi:hypothetical protein